MKRSLLEPTILGLVNDAQMHLDNHVVSELSTATIDTS